MDIVQERGMGCVFLDTLGGNTYVRNSIITIQKVIPYRFETTQMMEKTTDFAFLSTWYWKHGQIGSTDITILNTES